MALTAVVLLLLRRGEDILMNAMFLRRGRQNRIEYTWTKYNVLSAYYWNKYDIGSDISTSLTSNVSDYGEFYDGTVYLTIASSISVEKSGNHLYVTLNNPTYQSLTIDNSSTAGGTFSTAGKYWTYSTDGFSATVTNYIGSSESTDLTVCYSTGNVKLVYDENVECWTLRGKTHNVIATVVQVAGPTSYGIVSSNSSNTYPYSGVSGSYFYEYSHNEVTGPGSTSYGNVTSYAMNMYPKNGIHSDGYWYVKV